MPVPSPVHPNTTSGQFADAAWVKSWAPTLSYSFFTAQDKTHAGAAAIVTESISPLLKYLIVEQVNPVATSQTSAAFAFALATAAVAA